MVKRRVLLGGILIAGFGHMQAEHDILKYVKGIACASVALKTIDMLRQMRAQGAANAQLPVGVDCKHVATVEADGDQGGFKGSDVRDVRTVRVGNYKLGFSLPHSDKNLVARLPEIQPVLDGFSVRNIATDALVFGASAMAWCTVSKYLPSRK